MEGQDSSKPQGDNEPRSRDGLQWQIIGPALGLFGVSAAVAFLRQDSSSAFRESAVTALATAFFIALATMFAGTMFFKLMNITPSGKALVAFWAVIMAGWWWFTR